MRITGGNYLNRRIVCPPGIIRPSMDRMRQSLFSILGDISGKSWLDLYTGSGVIGIEAASRGAVPVTLVEKDPGKRAIIRQNLSFVEEEIKLVVMPVERFIRMQKIAYDFIFMDPPFKQQGKIEVIESISDKELLEIHGVLIIHVPSVEDIPGRIGRFGQCDRRAYGGSILCFYRYDTEFKEDRVS